MLIEVANIGEPITVGVLPPVFEPFRRAHALEKSRTGNLALGLYIANQIGVSHDGTLAGRSEGGETTFAVRLPHDAVKIPRGFRW